MSAVKNNEENRMKPNTRKIAFLAGLDFASMPVQKVTTALSEAGYQGVSWPLARFDPFLTNSSERNHLLLETHSAGLQVSEWVLQVDYICIDREERNRRIAHTKEVIHAIADLYPDAPINIFTGPAPWIPDSVRLGVDLSEGQAWEILDLVLEEVLPLAEGKGVKLAVEAVFGHLVHDYYTTSELLHRYPSPALGVNYDPSHGILYQNDIQWVIKQLGKNILHVHLKDAVGRPGGLPGDTFIFPLLGEGNINWQAFFNALDEIKYKGFLTVEFESFAYYKNILKSDPKSAAKISLENIQQLCKKNNEEKHMMEKL